MAILGANMDPMDPKQASRCQECHRDFHFYGLFERHLVDIHGEDEVLHCATCNTSFKRKMNLVLHWRSTAHRETKLVGCDICDAFNLSNGFPTEEALADHTSTVHGPKVHLNAKEQAEYFCPICQKKFTHRKGMIEHLQVLHGEHLYGHMLREEGQAKADLLTRRLYRCEDCQKSFRVKSTLNRHREKFHDDYSHWSKNPNRGKPENQQIAAQFLSQQQSSPPTAAVGQVHASPRTAAGRVYSCADCGQTFSSATTLSVHTEMVHNITTVNAASEDEDVEQVLEESEPVPVIQRQGLLGRPVVRNGRNPHLPALAKRPKTEELPPPITTDSSSEDDEDSINRRYHRTGLYSFEGADGPGKEAKHKDPQQKGRNEESMAKGWTQTEFTHLSPENPKEVFDLIAQTIAGAEIEEMDSRWFKLHSSLSWVQKLVVLS
eukprot:snap_masked-scaffold12_size759060-processed-gene-5.11 protein:Tk05584 transcript:snap_masked-scaffold12_size759060-processed-gene-5.11-mRNA-1 annotation:"zinc finger protein 2 homolog"